MMRFDPEVWKVWHRYGRLQTPPIAEVPYLPYLPHLTPRPCERAPAHIRARVRSHIYVRKVWKVWNRQCFSGFQPSIPMPHLGEVWQG